VQQEYEHVVEVIIGLEEIEIEEISIERVPPLTPNRWAALWSQEPCAERLSVLPPEPPSWTEGRKSVVHNGSVPIHESVLAAG
jgi:hypothetical protein